MPRKPTKDPAAVSLGRKGGRARQAAMTPEQRKERAAELGRARAASLTPERRSEIARKASKAAAKARKEKP